MTYNYFVFQKHTVFIPLKFLYPECSSLLDHYPNYHPLHCFKNDHCPANIGCMDILVKRVNFIFNEVVPEGKLLIAYFKWHDKPNSIRAGIFTKELDSPSVKTLNVSAFKKLQGQSTVYSWTPSSSYLDILPSSTLLPASSLLVKANGRTSTD